MPSIPHTAPTLYLLPDTAVKSDSVVVKCLVSNPDRENDGSQQTAG